MVWWLQTVLYTAGALCAAVLLVALFRGKRPIRELATSTVQGACALAAVNVAGAFTGVSLGINWFSAVACAAFGVPGVVGMLLLKLIFAI